MKKLDLETWTRKDIYTHYLHVSHPNYTVCFNIDVTNLYRYVKEHQLSFYYSMIYLCTKAINNSEAFLVSYENNELVILDSRMPSFTDLKKDSDAFYIVTVDHISDIILFNQKAKAKSEAQNCFINYDEEGNHLIYFSCLPWIDVTSITNEFDESTCQEDSIPRIAWGKYTAKDDHLTLNMSLEVNHRFIDGYHVGMFANTLQEYINEL